MDYQFSYGELFELQGAFDAVANVLDVMKSFGFGKSEEFATLHDALFGIGSVISYGEEVCDELISR